MFFVIALYQYQLILIYGKAIAIDVCLVDFPKDVKEPLSKTERTERTLLMQ
jgi:hypothetical protein